ncbi:MAG: CoB--CoM heterodisulfide reductase iron-sulfur subunit B family protein [Candidatus Bathyarchaeota archaeon]|nr:MAG: CoB--CoM heterodisulfide reductase iron-sulfur subunit B family protein [Candidatus Bathyarchaeota archaeon]
MKYAFFPGCLAPVMSRQFELSTRKVAKKLGLELIDMKNFACCGFPIKSVDQETTLLLAARNLSVAEGLGLDICTICTGCASTLAEANKELMHNDGLREKVNEKLQKIGRTYKGNVKVKHFVRILYEDVGPEKIKGQVKKSLEGLKLASHYGCHYLKPSDVFDKFEDPEFPRSLDELVSALGAETLEYEEKMQCCGGVILDVDDKIALAMAQKKLDHVSAMGADAMVLMCPLCGSMYDRNQRVMERRFNVAYDLPVLFYPQVLGLALGIDPKGLGLDLNRVKTSDLLSKLGV